MKIAVSSCLLGNKVRFDSGHKHDHFITDELSRYAEFIPFCPENLAFGNPRPSVRVIRDENNFIIQSNKDESDLTDALRKASHTDLETIDQHALCGIIFKSKSPSCGLNSAKAYLPNGFAEGKTDGMFAGLCKKKYPLLPMEEEGRLNDPWLRENFIMQVFAYKDFEDFKTDGPDMKALVDFHQSYKFMLQSKNDVSYRKLGKIVGNHEKKNSVELLDEYELLFKETIAKKSSIGKTRNVLEHMAGFVKNDLNEVEKKALHEQIRDYSDKIIPLISPLNTLAMFAQKYEASYLLGQKFLHPYPKELALRSDIRSGK